MKPGNQNSFNSLKSININGSNYKYYSISEAEKNGLTGISKLPKSLKVLLENLLRYEDDLSVTKKQIDVTQNCGTEEPFDNEYWNKQDACAHGLANTFCGIHCKFTTTVSWQQVPEFG